MVTKKVIKPTLTLHAHSSSYVLPHPVLTPTDYKYTESQDTLVNLTVPSTDSDAQVFHIA